MEHNSPDLTGREVGVRHLADLLVTRDSPCRNLSHGFVDLL